MVSKSMLATILLPMISNHVAAGPIKERGLFSKSEGTPWFCQVIGNENGIKPYSYIDLSKECQDAGLSDSCCMSFVWDHTDAWTEQDRTDLMNVIAQQSKKEGRYKTSHVGKWKAYYDPLVGRHDLITSDLLQIWFHAIQSFDLPNETSGEGDLVFQIADGTGGISNYMRVTRDDSATS